LATCLYRSILLIAATASGLHAQIPGHVSREGRVVVYSPHFDTPAPAWGGLSCPARPLALYGFETDPGRANSGELLVRVFDYFKDGRGGTPLRAAMLFLTHKLTPDSTIVLPQQNPHTALTDSTGAARFSTAAGVYRIKFLQLGYLGGEGIIRIRENTRDSLHAYLDQAAIC
jgi:hypothetical protein